MRQYNIREAKTHLSRLINMAVNGEPFIIAKAGKPMVTITAYQSPAKPAQRIGFMSGQIEDDFDTMGNDALLGMFGVLQRDAGRRYPPPHNADRPATSVTSLFVFKQPQSSTCNRP
jgi:antitoxin (DNA-binding transcriptional repressor) of toxin-antitoxin stability system